MKKHPWDLKPKPYDPSHFLLPFTLLRGCPSSEVQILEAERRSILEVPASELTDWQERRHRAAVMVQAHWRGLMQRRKLARRSPEDLKREQVGRLRSDFVS